MLRGTSVSRAGLQLSFCHTQRNGRTAGLPDLSYFCVWLPLPAPSPPRQAWVAGTQRVSWWGSRAGQAMGPDPQVLGSRLHPKGFGAPSSFSSLPSSHPWGEGQGLLKPG